LVKRLDYETLGLNKSAKNKMLQRQFSHLRFSDSTTRRYNRLGSKVHRVLQSYDWGQMGE